MAASGLRVRVAAAATTLSPARVAVTPPVLQGRGQAAGPTAHCWKKACSMYPSVACAPRTLCTATCEACATCAPPCKAQPADHPVAKGQGQGAGHAATTTARPPPPDPTTQAAHGVAAGGCKAHGAAALHGLHNSIAGSALGQRACQAVHETPPPPTDLQVNGARPLDVPAGRRRRMRRQEQGGPGGGGAGWAHGLAGETGEAKRGERARRTVITQTTMRCVIRCVQP